MALTCLPITSRFVAFSTTFSIFTPRAPLTYHLISYLRSVNRISANGHLCGRVTFKKLISSEQHPSEQKHQAGKQAADHTRDQSGSRIHQSRHIAVYALPKEEDRTRILHMDFAPRHKDRHPMMDICASCDDRACISAKRGFLRLDESHCTVLRQQILGFDSRHCRLVRAHTICFYTACCALLQVHLI